MNAAPRIVKRCRDRSGTSRLLCRRCRSLPDAAAPPRQHRSLPEYLPVLRGDELLLIGIEQREHVDLQRRLCAPGGAHAFGRSVGRVACRLPVAGFESLLQLPLLLALLLLSGVETFHGLQQQGVHLGPLLGGQGERADEVVLVPPGVLGE